MPAKHLAPTLAQNTALSIQSIWLALPGDVGVELAQVLVAKFVDLQFHQHMAFQDAVVEDQIDEAPGSAVGDALLLRLQAEAMAQLQQEFAQMVQQGRFKIGFGHRFAGAQAEKLEDVRVADRQLRFGGLDPL